MGKKKLEVKQSKTGTYVPDLTQRRVHNYEEVIQFIQVRVGIITMYD